MLKASEAAVRVVVVYNWGAELRSRTAGRE